MEAAELRQAAVPRRFSARSDPSAAAVGPRGDREGRAVPRRAARGAAETEADPLEIEREAKIPDRVVDGTEEDRCAGDEGAPGVRRAWALSGVLQQGAGDRRQLSLGDLHAASAHQSIGVAEPLRMFGSEEQRQKWLPLVAKDHISAFLLTEPGVGSDPARMARRDARRAGDRRSTTTSSRPRSRVAT